LSDAEAGTVANADSGKIDAMYIVDGKEMSNADAQAFLKNANNIMSINVKKDPSNRAKGIMEITTTENKDVTYFVDGKKVSAVEARALNNTDNAVSYRKDSSNPNKSIVEITTNPNKDAIYFIDDKEVSSADAHAMLKSGNFFASFPKKDPANPGKNIIEILTKKPIDVVLLPPAKNDPLYILDGKEIKPSDYKSVDRNNIEGIYVLQNNAAIAKYGDKGKNGVILIFTKSYTGPLPPATITTTNSK